MVSFLSECLEVKSFLPPIIWFCLSSTYLLSKYKSQCEIQDFMIWVSSRSESYVWVLGHKKSKKKTVIYYWEKNRKPGESRKELATIVFTVVLNLRPGNAPLRFREEATAPQYSSSVCWRFILFLSLTVAKYEEAHSVKTKQTETCNYKIGRQELFNRIFNFGGSIVDLPFCWHNSTL